MINAQKHSKDIVKIIHVTSLVQLYNYEATRILLVHKENKKNERFFSSASPYSVILESITMHEHTFPAHKQSMRVMLLT